MRFGTSYDDFSKQDSSTNGGGTFIRAFKEGDTVIHFLTEPAEWVGYLEHYNPNPGGFSFPCTQENTCPGCNSELEKMRSKGRKVVIPVVVDDKWVNLYKIPKKFAERLAKRADRFGTLLDRSYVITRTGTGIDTDYDVESGDKDRYDFDPDAYIVPDVEQLLEDTFHQVWGDEATLQEQVMAKRPAKKAAKAPKSDAEYSETQLRAMPPAELLKILYKEYPDLPDEIADSEDSNVITNWVVEKNKVPF